MQAEPNQQGVASIAEQRVKHTNKNKQGKLTEIFSARRARSRAEGSGCIGALRN